MTYAIYLQTALYGDRSGYDVEKALRATPSLHALHVAGLEFDPEADGLSVEADDAEQLRRYIEASVAAHVLPAAALEGLDERMYDVDEDGELEAAEKPFPMRRIWHKRDWFVGSINEEDSDDWADFTVAELRRHVESVLSSKTDAPEYRLDEMPPAELWVSARTCGDLEQIARLLGLPGLEEDFGEFED